MVNGRSKFVMRIAVLSCCVSMAWGQQEPPPGSAGPLPQSSAGQAPSQTGTNPPSQGEQGSQQEAPEMPPLTSGITLEPGSQGSSISYFLPSFQWSGFVDRVLSQRSEQNGTLTRSIYLGNIVLQQVRRRSQLNLDYAAGAQFYGRPVLTNTKVKPPGWGSVQRLSVAESIKLRRLELTLSDQFMYLPESSFGFPGFSGLQSFGGGSGGAFLGQQVLLSQSLLPTESILSGSSRRYTEVVLGEVQYSPTTRSTITATADAGVINFIDPGFVNSRLMSFNAGYNYRLTSHDEVSVSVVDYGFSYESTGGRSIVNRGFLFGYGHQFSSRFSFFFSGGPSEIKEAQSQGTFTEPLFLTNDSIRYRSRIADFDARFTRYTSAGSGVFHGAETEWLRLSAGRKVLGKLHGAVDLGHAFNQSIQRQAGQQAQFESWEAGFRLSREFREHASLYAQYQYQYQVGSNSPCSAFGCSRVFGRHLVGAGVNWHGRPRRIR